MRFLGIIGLVLTLGACSGDEDVDPIDTDSPPIETDGTDSDTVVEPPETDPVETDESDTQVGGDTDDTDAFQHSDSDTAFIKDTGAGDTFTPETAETAETAMPPVDTAPEGCTVGFTEDCDGTCIENGNLNAYLTNGVCDAGGGLGTPNLNCPLHAFDNGDCLDDTAPDPGAPCPDPLDARDCNDECYPLVWIGDGNCDDGTTHPYGSPDFDCPLYSNDNGDCAVP